MHEGRNVVPDVHAVLDKMADFTYRLHGGDWKGHTGKRIRNHLHEFSVSAHAACGG